MLPLYVVVVVVVVVVVLVFSSLVLLKKETKRPQKKNGKKKGTTREKLSTFKFRRMWRDSQVLKIESARAEGLIFESAREQS